MKVTWIVQSNLGSSEDAIRIFRACSKLNMTFVGQPVVPFSKRTADHHTDLPTIFYGATNWINSVFLQNDWSPGVFFNPNSVCSFWFKKYRKNALNYGARFTTFSEVAGTYDSELEANKQLFVRPDGDNKEFPGRVMALGKIERWEETMSGDIAWLSKLPILITGSVDIGAEWRLFLVDGEVSSGSQYRLHGKLWKKPYVPIEVVAFAEKMAKVYSPAPVFVMDVCSHEDELKIIEIGCFNSAGFYDADIEKIIYDVSKYAERAG